MKYFVCSDIHGFYDEWIDALCDAGFELANPDHIIILCGDLLDRGPCPLECLEFVCDLIDKSRIICIMGNHELLLRDATVRNYFMPYDVSNGTVGTVSSLVNRDSNRLDKFGLYISDEQALQEIFNHKLWNKYFDECLKRFYLETDHYIFVHSWVAYYPYSFDYPYNKDWRDDMTKNRNLYDEWHDQAVWGNPFKLWEDNGRKGIDGKTIVCGHWHTSWAHWIYNGYDTDFRDVIETMWLDSEGVEHPTVCHDIFYGNGIIGLDACTVVSHQVNVLVLNEL